jgi:hypothetical protein
MVIVWTIACGESTAEVYEHGKVESDDAALAGRLNSCLSEPVDVTLTGAGGRPLELAPDDRRYVVARVRKLVADEPDLEVVAVRFD